MTAYGTLQLKTQQDTLGARASWLHDNQRRVRELEGQFVDGVEVRHVDLPRLRAESLEAERLCADVLTAGGAGVIARHASIAGVRSFAVSRTGTAISGLTRAAANNAALAWLGGGTLTSRGGGMTAGASVRTGVDVAPAPRSSSPGSRSTCKGSAPRPVPGRRKPQQRSTSNGCGSTATYSNDWCGASQNSTDFFANSSTEPAPAWSSSTPPRSIPRGTWRPSCAPHLSCRL